MAEHIQRTRSAFTHTFVCNYGFVFMNTDMLSNLCLIVLRLTIYSQTKMYSDTFNISHISTHLYSKKW